MTVLYHFVALGLMCCVLRYLVHGREVKLVDKCYEVMG